jgi:outer membrane receptor protein involved in Fe transport
VQWWPTTGSDKAFGSGAIVACLREKAMSLRFLTFHCALACAAAMPSAHAQTALQELEDLLNQPVYAASKYAESAAAAPAAVTVLTAGDIRSFGWRTLGEVLNAVRGVYLRDDRIYTYVGVRGFARPGDYSSRLLVTIDGMRVNDNIYDQALGGREMPVDVAMIERVEFIAGPGSALYGSNALLAVVNIVTKSASTLGGGNATLGLGSQGQRSAALRWGGNVAAGSLVLGAHVERVPGRDLYFAAFDDPATADGIAPGRLNNESDHKLYAKWSQGAWQAAWSYSNHRRDSPTGSYGTDFGAPALSRDRYSLADLRWQQPEGVSQWIAHASLGEYKFAGTGQYGADTIEYDQTGRWLTAEARWHYSGWQSHRVALGGEVQRNLSQRQIITTVGQSPQINAVEGDGWRAGLFANDEWRFAGDWRAVMGLRLDRLLSGKHDLSPRLALLWQAQPGLHLKWLEGRAYREPNAWEAQYGDLTQLPNPALNNERLRASELAVEWRAAESLRLAGSLYRNRVSDLIDQVTLQPSGLLQYQNVGRAEGRGIELEADYVAIAGWRVRASWSRAKTVDGETGLQLGNSPRSLLKAQASLPLPWWGARLSAEAVRVGQRLTMAGKPMPSHMVANATLRFAPAGTPWSLSLSAYNLFDKDYADPAGPEHLQETLQRDGRRLQMQLSHDF